MTYSTPTQTEQVVHSYMDDFYSNLPNRVTGLMPEVPVNEYIANGIKLLGFIALSYLLVGGSAYVVFKMVTWIF